MQFTPVAELPGLIIVEPTVHTDHRGFFMESYQRLHFARAGLDIDFVQENHSYSVRNVLRGLHFQHPHAQGKLVRVTRGEIYDVAVDIRVGSPTFGRWAGITLSDSNRRQLYIPPGFAHGFAVLSDEADVIYRCSEFYHPDADRSLAWNDPDLAIDWPVARPIISEKDSKAPTLRALECAGALPQYDQLAVTGMPG